MDKYYFDLYNNIFKFEYNKIKDIDVNDINTSYNLKKNVCFYPFIVFCSSILIVKSFSKIKNAFKNSFDIEFTKLNSAKKNKIELNNYNEIDKVTINKNSSLNYTSNNVIKHSNLLFNVIEDSKDINKKRNYNYQEIVTDKSDVINNYANSKANLKNQDYKKYKDNYDKLKIENNNNLDENLNLKLIKFGKYLFIFLPATIVFISLSYLYVKNQFILYLKYQPLVDKYYSFSKLNKNL